MKCVLNKERYVVSMAGLLSEIQGSRVDFNVEELGVLKRNLETLFDFPRRSEAISCLGEIEGLIRKYEPEFGLTSQGFVTSYEKDCAPSKIGAQTYGRLRQCMGEKISQYGNLVADKCLV